MPFSLWFSIASTLIDILKNKHPHMARSHLSYCPWTSLIQTCNCAYEFDSQAANRFLNERSGFKCVRWNRIENGLMSSAIHEPRTLVRWSVSRSRISAADPILQLQPKELLSCNVSLSTKRGVPTPELQWHTLNISKIRQRRQTPKDRNSSLLKRKACLG